MTNRQILALAGLGLAAGGLVTMSRRDPRSQGWSAVFTVAGLGLTAMAVADEFNLS